MRLARNIIFALGDFLGLNLLFSRLNADKIRVLMYHGVSVHSSSTSVWTVLSTEKFDWQMKYLQKRYNVVSSSQVLLAAGGSTNDSKPPTVITFDDGLENTLTEALPILERYGLTATCFVVPDLAERGETIWADRLFEMILDYEGDVLDLGDDDLPRIHLSQNLEERTEQGRYLLDQIKSWPDEHRQRLVSSVFSQAEEQSANSSFRLMSIDQMRRLSETSVFEIGYHSDNHPIMSSLSAEDQDSQLENSERRLEKHGIAAIPLFAYPNGRREDYNVDTIAALNRHGLKAAVTTIDGMWDGHSDHYEIPRICIGADISHWEFKARLSGFFYFLYRLRNRDPPLHKQGTTDQ